MRISEGQLKSDVATVLSGVLTIGLPGVSAWRQALPVLHALRVRTVHVAFDADARVNLLVANTLRLTVRALQKEGFQVQLEQWHEADGKGIDDVLVSGGVTEVLEGTTMWEAIRGMARSAWRANPLRYHRPDERPQTGQHECISGPLEDPWGGTNMLPFRPYRGYRGMTIRKERTHG
jgi:hypothetical protein